MAALASQRMPSIGFGSVAPNTPSQSGEQLGKSSESFEDSLGTQMTFPMADFSKGSDL